MAKVYVFANQKGGVTKTTTTVATAVMGNLSGKRGLVVDGDPQGNSTFAMGYNPNELQHTVYTLMQKKSTLDQVLKPTYFHPRTGAFFDPTNVKSMQALGLNSLQEARRGPDLLPNNIVASSADIELQHPAWGSLLRQILFPLDQQYEEIYIDTNPSLGKLTVNGLCCADAVIIPMTPEAWSAIGMVQLAASVVVAKDMNPSLQVAGVLFTRYRYASHRRVTAQVKDDILLRLEQDYPVLKPIKVFETMINESSLFGEVANDRSTVIVAGPDSFASISYWSYYVELLKRTKGTGQEQAIANFRHLYGLYKQKELDVAEKKQSKKSTPVKGE